MSSQLSDIPDPTLELRSTRPIRRTRYATWPGRATILAVLSSVILLSCGGGTYAQLADGVYFSAPYAKPDFWLCRGMELTIGFWLFAVGCSIASFLNVVAWRAPQGLSIQGFSICPRCQIPISAVDNIPIVGWLRLRGRCATCQLPISPKYPVFEALGGYLFIVLYAVEFLSHGANLPVTIMAHSKYYGMPVHFAFLSPQLIWIFASHLVLVSTLLAIFMTRQTGDVLPPKLLLFPLTVCLAIVFWELRASNVSLDLLQIIPAEARSVLLLHLIAAGAFLGALVAIAYRIFVGKLAWLQTNREGSTDEGTHQATAIAPNSREFRSWLLYALAALTICVTLGVPAAILVSAITFACSQVYKASGTDNNHALHWLSAAQSWLLPVTFVFILTWRYWVELFSA